MVAVEAFLKDQQSVLLVIHSAERERILNEYAIPVNRRSDIVTPENASKYLKGRHNRRIIADNADLILQVLLRTYEPISLVTMTDNAILAVQLREEEHD